MAEGSLGRVRSFRVVLVVVGLTALPGVCAAHAPGRQAVAAPVAAAATGTVAVADSVLTAAGATGSTGVATTAAGKPGSATLDNANASLKSADASAVLLGQIARLPPLVGTSLDVAKRSAEVRAHLNAILRFYRTAIVPVQQVGEPSDVLYGEQSQAEAVQIAQTAFGAAKNEAALLNRVPGAANANGVSGASGASGISGASGASKSPAAQSLSSDGGQSQAERISAVRAQAQEKLVALQAQHSALEAQLTKARGDGRATLLQQQEQIEGGLELQQAMVEALGKINAFTAQQAQTGLAGDIDRLQRSAPELLSKPLKTPPPPVLESVSAAHEAGVSTQAGVLFRLLGTLHTIDQQIKAIDQLSKQAEDLRTPFINVLRSTLQQGQALTQQSIDLQATPTTDAQDLVNTRKQFDTLTFTFQVLANATLPLSQENVLLDNARGTLTTWRATVDAEYKEVLRSLLVRVAIIAMALGMLAILNRVLNGAAVKYISDVRRRRQLLLLRRILVGFLTGLVLIFGFVTQFSSLATFAGFITAGIAVGLQSILLSVAAYFFIVGRYGIRVGDRVTVAGVTGEVIEVGLVRFYMIELVGSGTELHSTGRVAVFANSVLFQSGTPIYKQMPGTEYAWHELTAKLNPGVDPKAASQAVLKVVTDVYATYHARIEAQNHQVESWMGTALPQPQVESRLQLTDGGLQFAVLFPVEIEHAAEVDQQIAEALVQGFRIDGPLKAGVSDLPIIKAAVKS